MARHYTDKRDGRSSDRRRDKRRVHDDDSYERRDEKKSSRSRKHMKNDRSRREYSRGDGSKKERSSRKSASVVKRERDQSPDYERMRSEVVRQTDGKGYEHTRSETVRVLNDGYEHQRSERVRRRDHSRGSGRKEGARDSRQGATGRRASMRDARDRPESSSDESSSSRSNGKHHRGDPDSFSDDSSVSEYWEVIELPEKQGLFSSLCCCTGGTHFRAEEKDSSRHRSDRLISSTTDGSESTVTTGQRSHGEKQIRGLHEKRQPIARFQKESEDSGSDDSVLSVDFETACTVVMYDTLLMWKEPPPPLLLSNEPNNPDLVDEALLRWKTPHSHSRRLQIEGPTPHSNSGTPHRPNKPADFTRNENSSVKYPSKDACRNALEQLIKKEPVGFSRNEGTSIKPPSKNASLNALEQLKRKKKKRKESPKGTILNPPPSPSMATSEVVILPSQEEKTMLGKRNRSSSGSYVGFQYSPDPEDQEMKHIQDTKPANYAENEPEPVVSPAASSMRMSVDPPAEDNYEANMDRHETGEGHHASVLAKLAQAGIIMDRDKVYIEPTVDLPVGATSFLDSCAAQNDPTEPISDPSLAKLEDELNFLRSMLVPSTVNTDHLQSDQVTITENKVNISGVLISSDAATTAQESNALIAKQKPLRIERTSPESETTKGTETRMPDTPSTESVVLAVVGPSKEREPKNEDDSSGTRTHTEESPVAKRPEPSSSTLISKTDDYREATASAEVCPEYRKAEETSQERAEAEKPVASSCSSTESLVLAVVSPSKEREPKNEDGSSRTRTHTEESPVAKRSEPSGSTLISRIGDDRGATASAEVCPEYRTAEETSQERTEAEKLVASSLLPIRPDPPSGTMNQQEARADPIASIKHKATTDQPSCIMNATVATEEALSVLTKEIDRSNGESRQTVHLDAKDLKKQRLAALMSKLSFDARENSSNKPSNDAREIKRNKDARLPRQPKPSNRAAAAHSERNKVQQEVKSVSVSNESEQSRGDTSSSAKREGPPRAETPVQVNVESHRPQSGKQTSGAMKNEKLVDQSPAADIVPDHIVFSIGVEEKPKTSPASPESMAMARLVEDVLKVLVRGTEPDFDAATAKIAKSKALSSKIETQNLPTAATSSADPIRVLLKDIELFVDYEKAQTGKLSSTGRFLTQGSIAIQRILSEHNGGETCSQQKVADKPERKGARRPAPCPENNVRRRRRNATAKHS